MKQNKLKKVVLAVSMSASLLLGTASFIAAEETPAEEAVAVQEAAPAAEASTVAAEPAPAPVVSAPAPAAAPAAVSAPAPAAETAAAAPVESAPAQETVSEPAAEAAPAAETAPAQETTSEPAAETAPAEEPEPAAETVPETAEETVSEPAESAPAQEPQAEQPQVQAQDDTAGTGDGSGDDTGSTTTDESESETEAPGADDVDTTDESTIPAGKAVFAENVTGGVNTLEETTEFTNATDDGDQVDTRNAIQKAVDAALAAARSGAADAELTITVEDGSYDGDITIQQNSEKPSILKTLYILATGSYTEPEEGAVIDKDTVSVSAAGGAKVNGNIFIDGINVVLAGLYYSLEKTISVKDSTTTVYGTTQDDTLTIKSENGEVIAKTGDGADTFKVTGENEGASGKSVALDGGAGSDVYTVDTSIAGSSGEANVSITDSDGGRLHYTGSIDGENATGAYNESDKKGTFSLQTKKDDANAGVLKVATDGVNRFSDELSGKKSVTLTEANKNNSFTDASFTDFVYKPVNNLAELTLNVGNGILNSLVIKEEPDENDMEINETNDGEFTVRNVNAGKANLRVEGTNITFDGNITADNLIVNAVDSDGIKLPEWVVDKLDLGEDDSFSLFNFMTCASINVKDSASINALGDVQLKATSTQGSGLIPYSGANAVNVKIGNALIDIDGTINAGGSVEAAASSKATMVASNELLKKIYIPLAVDVAVNTAKVTLGTSGSIRAAEDVKLTSNAELKMTTVATVGKLPFSLAVGVPLNDSHVTVNGDITSTGGSITAEAKGSMTAVTEAAKEAKSDDDDGGDDDSDDKDADPSSLQFGGFFAIAVAIQDVDATVGENASLTAAKDITIHSESKQSVTTNATSSSGDADGQTETESKVSEIFGKLKKIVGTVKEFCSGKEKEGNGIDAKAYNYAVGLLNKAMGRIAGSSGNAITATPTENGILATKTKAEVGDTVTVTVTPNKGYKLDSLTYSYIPAGASKAVVNTITATDGKYTFEMPSAAVTLKAIFVEDESASDDEPTAADLFDDGEKKDDSDDDNLGLEDVFNEGTSGSDSATDSGTPTDPVTEGSITITNFESTDKTEGDNPTSQGSILSDHAKANTGDKITLTINPADGYQLKEGTLRAIYKNADGKKIRYTIAKTSSGQYIFTMPEVKEGTELTFDASFEKKPEEQTERSNDPNAKTSVQATGALAVSVVLNNNEAVIDTNGKITCGGKLSVTADASTKSESNANASGVEEHEAEKKSDDKKSESSDTFEDEVYQEQIQGSVVIASTTNGKVEFASQESTPVVAVKVTPSEGFKLKSLKAEVTTDYDGKLQTRTVDLKANTSYEGVYYLDGDENKKLLSRNFRIIAEFEGVNYTITSDSGTDITKGSVSISAAEAKCGDKITVTPTAYEGQMVSAVYYLSEGHKTQVEKDSNGKYIFRLPAKKVTVLVQFDESGYPVYTAADSKSIVTVSVPRTADGRNFVVTPVDSSKTLKSVSVTYGYSPLDFTTDSPEVDYSDTVGELETAHIVISAGTATVNIPSELLAEGMILIVSAVLGDDDNVIPVSINVATTEQDTNPHGTISTKGYVRNTEKLTLNVTPDAGYKADAVQLKFTYTDSNNEEVTDVVDVEKNDSGEYVYDLSKLTSIQTATGITMVVSGKFVVEDAETAGLNTSTSLGVAINVTVTNHSNLAIIRKGTIEAGSVEVTANSKADDTPVTSTAKSSAGYNKGDIGAGGAVTVHVASEKTKAYILKNAVLSIADGGDLKVSAVSGESFSTVADASKSKDTQAKSTGVGAGIAVAVTGAEVIAAIQEDTVINAVKEVTDETTGVITKEAGSLNSVTVSAEQSAKDTATASAGSAGGVSVSPALTVHVSGIRTEAYIGAAPANALQPTIVAGGDIIVSADSNIEREVGTNAAAAGGSVGVGIAPVVSVYNDSSRAKMMRGSKSRNLKVNAKGISTVKSTARSGSKGAAGKEKKTSGSSDSSDGGSSDGDGGSDKGDSDKQADKNLAGATKLAGSTGMSNIDPNFISSKSSNRQTAETSEGNLQVAAAFNLNIFNHEVEAYIAGDFTSEAEENIEVTVIGKVDVSVSANASATGAKTGIGAAVALNIASYEHIAHVDQAALIAGGDITVKASLPEEEKESSDDEKDEEEEGKKEYDFTTEAGVKSFIEDKTLEYIKKAAEAMKLYTICFNDTLKSHLDSLLKELATNLTSGPLEKLIKDTPLEKFELSKLKEGDFNTYKDLVIGQISNNIGKALKDNAKKLWDSVKEEAKKYTDATTWKNLASQTISTTMIDCLADWITIKKEDESPANTFKTEAIAGAGASDVGVAGSIAIAIVNGEVKAYVDSAEKPVTADGEINVNAQNNTRQETTATAAVTDDGSADKNLSDPDAKSGSENDQEEQTVDKKVVVAAAKGGKPTATISGSTVTVTVNPMEGYEIDAVKVFKTKGNTAIEATANADKTEYTFTLPTLADGETVTVQVTYKEVPRNITITKVDPSQTAAYAVDNPDPCKVSVTTPSNTDEQETSSKSKWGDKVTVRVTPTTGYRLKDGSLKFKYTADGEEHEVQIVTVEDSANGIYSFYMPDADITICAEFEEDPNPSQEDEAKTKNGTTVGVGAAFALDIININTEAGIGENRTVTGKTVSITADSGLTRVTASVAGTDPFAYDSSDSDSSDGGEAKDVSVDASASIGLTDNNVKAYVGKGTAITTTGVKAEPAPAGDGTTDGTVTGSEEAEEETKPDTAGDFVLTATEHGKSTAQSSAYAVGNQTAVGATVVLNIADSDVNVVFDGSVNATGDATLKAYAYNEDDSTAFATAMGSDIDRYLTKVKSKVTDKAEKINKLMSGEFFQKEETKTGNENNKTATTINDKLNENKNNSNKSSDQASRQDVSNNLSTSTNILSSQNVSTESTDTGSAADNAAEQANSTVSGENDVTGGQGTGTPTDKKKSQPVQAAAALGVNITNHVAKTEVNGNVSGRKLLIMADNDANYTTTGTGLSMTLGKSDTSVALGVAVAVNNDKALVIIKDGTQTEHVILVGTEEVKIASELSQNMDGEYKGLLGVQSLAGSVSGSADTAIAGAVSVLTSKAQTKTIVGSWTEIRGGDTAEENEEAVIVTAEDKSKLAGRAGGVMIAASGAKTGIGAAFALIYGSNIVTAQLNDNVRILAKSLDLHAEKKSVSFDDFELAYGLENIVTRHQGDDEIDDDDKGIIHLERKGTGTEAHYEMQLNMSSDRIMDAVKVLNVLSSVNLYLEAISGAVSTGAGDFAGAGSFAMAFLNDEVLSSIGDNAFIQLTGDMKNNASSETNVRVISGGLSVSNSSLGVGAVLSLLYDEDKVNSKVGKNVVIIADGSYEQSASSQTDILDITVAGAATGSSGELTVGANLGAVVLLTTAQADVNDSASIKAGGNLDILSTQDNDTVLIAASVALSMGGIAGSGTINVTVSNSEANINIADGVTLTAGKDLTIKADTTERIISVLASASASNSKAAGSGVVSVLVDNAKTCVIVGRTKITAGGNVNILADSNTKLYQINAAASVGNTAAVGAIMAVNVLGRTVLVQIANGTQITAVNGSAVMKATGEEKVLLILGSAAASTNVSVTGLIPVIVSNSKVQTLLGLDVEDDEYQGGTETDHAKVTAGDSIGVIARLESDVAIVAGGLSVGSNGVGATIDTAVLKNTIDALVGDWAELIAGGITVAEGTTTGIQTPNREERRHGVIISATGKEDITMVSIAASGGLENAVSGVVNTLVVSNKTNAAAREHVTMSAKAVSGSSDDGCSHPEVTVEADDDTDLVNIAGALSAAGSAGVGATIVVNVFSKEVNAEAADNVDIDTTGDVNVTATADDDVVLFALGLSASGTAAVAASANAMVFQNHTHAVLGGTVGAEDARVRNVTVLADSDALLVNLALDVAASSGAAVSGAAIVTYFYNETLSYVKAGSRIFAEGNVKIEADSKEIVTADGLGIAGAGGVGVGGTLDVVVTKVVTRAYTEENVTINTNGSDSDVSVIADDDYDLIAVVGTIVGGGAVGVGVSGLVTVSYNTVTALIGENNTVNAGRDILVNASSDRLVQGYTLTIGAGGAAGVSASVVVIVAGSLLSDDAHNAIYVKDGDSSSIDPQAQTDGTFAQGNSYALDGYKPEDSMDDLLAGDGSSSEGTVNGGGSVDYNDYGQDVGDAGDETTSSDNMNDDTYDSVSDGIKRDGEKKGATDASGKELSDSTTAQVTTGSTLTAGRNVKVTSNDHLSSYVVSGNVAAGGGAGVGVGLSIVVLYSNVQAIVEENVTINAAGDVVVKAVSGATETEKPELQFADNSGNNLSTKSAEDKLKSDDSENPAAQSNTSTIFLVGVTAAGGGVAGVSVTTASMNLLNKTIARLSGTVNGAENVEVTARTEYGTVLAAAIAASAGGVAGVAAPIALTYAESETTAAIDDNAKINGVTGKIHVNAGGVTNATAICAAVAGAGVAGVAGSVSVAVNRSEFKAYIGPAVVIDSADADVVVDAELMADARTVIASVAAGGAAGVSAAVSVAVNRPTLKAYIGTEPDADDAQARLDGDAAQSGAVTGSVTAHDVTVDSRLTGETSVIGASLAAGGVAGVNGSVALGFNKAENMASIKGANINASGDISVYAGMKGDTTVTSSAVSGGFVGFGANVGLARIESINMALIDTKGGNVNAGGSISVKAAGTEDDTPYDTEALVTVVSGTAGAFAGAMNFAVGLNEARNIAAAGGADGSLAAGGDLDVTADGRSKAYGIVINGSAGIGTANVAYALADLKSMQTAEVFGETSVTAKNLNVTSTQNQSGTAGGPITIAYKDEDSDGDPKDASKTINPATMAEAYIFSLTEGLASIDENVVEAVADASSAAKVQAKDLKVTENINITNTADSYAKASTENISVTLVSIGTMAGKATAKGDFKAILESSGSVEAGGKINVTNTWNGKADCIVIPSAGGVKLGSTQDNTADAIVDTTATAGIEGTGTVKAGSDITVLNQSEDVKAFAKIDGVQIDIELASATVNQSTANMTATQTTYIKGVTVTSTNGSVTVTGNLAPESYAQTGTNDLSAKGTLASLDVTSVSAYSSTTNEAYIQNASVYAENGKVAVNAATDSKTTAKAIQPTFELSWQKLGVIAVNTDSNDIVKAYIDSDDGKIIDITGKRVDVIAEGKATVTAIGSLPFISVSGEKAEAVVLEADAASSKDKATWAYIGKDTRVTALGADDSDDMHSVNVKAESDLTVETQMPISFSISGYELGFYNITTKTGKTDTRAYIGGEVLSYQDINVSANDKISASSDIEMYNAGLFKGGLSLAGNYITSQNVQAYILDNAKLLAWGNINVLAHSDLDLEAGVKTAGISLASAGSAESRNEITERNVTAKVGDNVSLISMLGNITVKADGEDTISTNTTGTSASIADLGGDPEAVIKYNAVIKTLVGNNTSIQAAYGNVDIVSNLTSDLYASAFRKAASVISANKSKADITGTVTIFTGINVDGDNQSKIVGKITTIGTYIRNQIIHSYALSETASFGSKTEAYATINIVNNLNTEIDNAWVGGTETLNVESIIEKQKLWAETYAEIVGATGLVYAYSKVDGENNVNISVTEDAELAGEVINVISDAPKLETSTISRDAKAIANTIVQKVWTKVKNVVEKVVKKVSKIPIIGWFVKWVTEKVIEWIDVLVEHVLMSDAETYEQGTYTSAGNVDLNGKIHVGGGAAGIFVDIFGDLLENVTVNTSGLDDDLKDDPYTIEDGKVVLNGIYNDDQGQLNVTAGTGNITGKVITYTNSYLPYAEITNHTDLDVVIRNLTLANAQTTAPSIITSAGGTQSSVGKDTNYTDGKDTFDYSTYAENIPELHIVSEKSGSIIFDSDKENGGMAYADVAEGSVYIVMNGGRLLTANGAYLAANKLYIGEGTGTDGTVLAGPDQIGNSKDDPFQAYVFDISEYAGLENVAAALEARPNEIKAYANGDIFLALTPVKEWMTRTQYDSVPAEGEVRINLNLAEITGGTGSTVYVNVLAAKKTCANKSELAEEYVISIPRSAMEFLTADRSGTELTEIQIYTADGQPTDFWLTADGKLLNKNSEVTFNADTYLVNENDDYDTYHLPNGTIIVVDKNTGTLAYITTEEGDEYDLSGYQVTLDKAGNVTAITLVNTNADADDWSQKIRFKDGKAWMEIGVNGATTYIETSGFEEDGFGWNLPNGIKIYFKQVFINEETSKVVQGTVIRTETDANGNKVSYIALENPAEGRSFWHVVKVTGESGSYTFQEGYLYAKTDLTSTTYTTFQTLDEAEEAAANVTSSLKTTVEGVLRNTLTAAGVSAQTVADKINTAIKNAYQSLITKNYKLNVNTTVNESTERYITSNDTQVLDGFDTIWSVVVTILTEDGAVNETLASLLNQTFAGTTNQKVTGTITTPLEFNATKNAESKTVIANSDNSVYFTYKNGSWTAHVSSGNTGYDYSMKQASTGWYEAVAPGSAGKKLDAYNQYLSGVAVNLGSSVTDASLGMFRASASGAVTEDSLNGGYVKLSGAVRFVESKDNTDKGIILIGGHIVAVFPDGTFGYVAGDGLNNAGTDKTTVSVTVSPDMEPRTYYDEKGVEHKVTDSEGNTIYDVQFRVEGETRADGTRTYRYQITKSDGSAYDGQLYADGYDSAFTVTNGVIELTDKEAAALVDGAYSVNVNSLSWIERFFGNNIRLQVSVAPMYTYAGNIIVVDPIEGTDGALLHFRESCEEFETRRDSNGLAILNRYTRIVDAYAQDNSFVKEQIEGLKQGTILFLNEDGTIAAYLAPDGSFRVYDGTRTQDDAADGKRVYADYSVGEDDKLHVTLSKNSSTNFMEVAQGTESSKDDDVLTSVYGLHEEGENLHNGYNYEDAHYFGYTADGTLVELVKEDRYFDYDEEGSLHKVDDASAALETGFALKNDRTALLTIINNMKEDTSSQKDRAVYVMYDDTALDSDGNISDVTSDTWREYEDAAGEDVNTNIGTVEGGDFELTAEGNVTGGTVDTTGDTDITVSGNVGTYSTPLTVNADGTVNVDAEGSLVNLKSDQDMQIDSINSADGTGTVKINAAGNINDTNGEDGTGATPAIAAGTVDLTAGGEVGTADNTFDTSTDNLSINANGSVTAANDKDVTADITSQNGDVTLNADGNVTAQNVTSQNGDVTLTADGNVAAEHIASPNGSVTLTADGDVTVTAISAKNSTTIKANGDVTGTANASGANITSDSLNIDTTGAGATPGNVGGTGGANGNALTTNVDNLSANAGNITIDNNNGANGTLTIDSVTGKDVNISTSGTMNGNPNYDPNITADNLTTSSGGNTENLSANVTGKVNQSSQNGSINTKINGATYTNNSADDIAKKNAEAAIPKNQIILAKAVATKKKVTLKWTAAEGATGYIIYWNGKVYKQVSASVRKLVIKGLKKKKVYNFKIVAVRNTTELGASLKSYTGIQLKKALPKKVKAKSKLTIKLKKSKKLKVTVVKKGSGTLLKKGRMVRFLLSQTGIVKVFKSGKIKALQKGKVTLYSIAVNGTWKKTVITVK